MVDDAAVRVLEAPDGAVEGRVVELRVERLGAGHDLERRRRVERVGGADVEGVGEDRVLDERRRRRRVVREDRVRRRQRVEERVAGRDLAGLGPQRALDVRERRLGVDLHRPEGRADLEARELGRRADAHAEARVRRAARRELLAEAEGVELDVDVERHAVDGVRHPAQSDAELHRRAALAGDDQGLLRVRAEHGVLLGLARRVRQVAARRRHGVERDRVRPPRERAGPELDLGVLGVLRRAEEAPVRHAAVEDRGVGVVDATVVLEAVVGDDGRHGQRKERAPRTVRRVEGLDAREVRAGRQVRGVDLHVEGLGPRADDARARHELELRRRLDPRRVAAEVEVQVERERGLELLRRALARVLEERPHLHAHDDAADGRGRGDLPRVAQVDAAAAAERRHGDVEGHVLGGLARVRLEVRHGADGVDQAEALREGVRGRHGDARVLERAPQRRRVRPVLERAQHARRDAAGVRRRHGRAVVLRAAREHVARHGRDRAAGRAERREPAVRRRSPRRERVGRVGDAPAVVREHGVLRLHHGVGHVGADGDGRAEAAGRAQARQRGAVVARGREHGHAPLPHGGVEGLRDAALRRRVVEGLAVAQVDEVDAVALAGDERADEARARLRRAQPAVADLQREDLRARRDAVGGRVVVVGGDLRRATGTFADS